MLLYYETHSCLQAIVPRTVQHDAEVAGPCCEAVEGLLAGDAGGSVRLEALQLMADLIRRRKCNAPPRLLKMLLGLQFSKVALPTGPSAPLPIAYFMLLAKFTIVFNVATTSARLDSHFYISCLLRRGANPSCSLRSLMSH